MEKIKHIIVYRGRVSEDYMTEECAEACNAKAKKVGMDWVATPASIYYASVRG